MAAVVVRGIVPAARDALTARLARRVSGARKPEGYDELEFILILLRGTLRDLAAIRSGSEALYGDPQGLREDAALAPAGEFAKAMLAAEETHRILFEPKRQPADAARRTPARLQRDRPAARAGPAARQTRGPVIRNLNAGAP